MKITKVTASSDFEEYRKYYYGKEEAEKYGDLICDKLAGKTVSKRKDLAEYPGGLIYEAENLGIEDFFDLLKALEGLCYQGRAAEIDDSTYMIYGHGSIAAGTDYKRISHFNEHDNPHILRGDWKKMSDEEAEEKAKQMSLDDPTDIYYVQYDDVMEPASDKRWHRGKAYDAVSQYDEMMEARRQPVESAEYIEDEDVKDYASALSQRAADKLVDDGFEVDVDVAKQYFEIRIVGGHDNIYNGYSYIVYFDEIVPSVYSDSGLENDAQQIYETFIDELVNEEGLNSSLALVLESKGFRYEDFLHEGSRVREMYANPYNVGTILEILPDGYAKVQWDYSDREDVEIVDLQNLEIFRER